MTDRELDNAVSKSELRQHLDRFCEKGCKIGEKLCGGHYCTALDLIYKIVNEGFDVQEIKI